VSAALVWLGSRSLAGPFPWQAFWLLPLLVPGAVLAESGGLWNLLTAALLVTATPWLPDASAAAAPLALAALAVRREGRTPIPQRVWTAALLAGTALLASYPWLRANPLMAALSLAGLVNGPGRGALNWRAGAAVLVPFVALAAICGGKLRSLIAPRALAGVSAAVILLAVFLHLPPRGAPLLPPETGVLLEPAHPGWIAGWAAPHRVGSVMVESSLTGGARLADGTPVGVVHLNDDAGRSALWILRAGGGTGEWAARRPDVERTAALHSPPAWISWVAGDFFGQRYRALWTLLEPRRFTHLRIELAPGLPPDVGLTLHQVEVRR
jgi:hypothetical protein